MNILQQLNAVDAERSSVEFQETHHVLVVNGKEKKFTVRTMGLLRPHTLVLKRVLVAGHHLWHGTNQDIYQVFFSEELYEAVHAANLSQLLYLHAKES